MKREEKNRLMQRRIINAALNEYQENGYGESSINNICNHENLSKGIVYHYFDSKDALYLTCVRECFNELTAYMRKNLSPIRNIEDGLNNYFHIRQSFFLEHTQYERIFKEALMHTPKQLKSQIEECRRDFDDFNIHYLTELLKDVKLRSDLNIEDVVDTLRHYQDYINASYSHDINLKTHENRCLKALNILLYGIIERKD
ncbi:MAG: TetR/AcrR family transcriptional regulator [Erysipelotrichaceae bacterium]